MPFETLYQVAQYVRTKDGDKRLLVYPQRLTYSEAERDTDLRNARLGVDLNAGVLVGQHFHMFA